MSCTLKSMKSIESVPIDFDPIDLVDCLSANPPYSFKNRLQTVLCSCLMEKLGEAHLVFS